MERYAFGSTQHRQRQGRTGGEACQLVFQRVDGDRFAIESQHGVARLHSASGGGRTHLYGIDNKAVIGVRVRRMQLDSQIGDRLSPKCEPRMRQRRVPVDLLLRAQQVGIFGMQIRLSNGFESGQQGILRVSPVFASVVRIQKAHHVIKGPLPLREVAEPQIEIEADKAALEVVAQSVEPFALAFPSLTAGLLQRDAQPGGIAVQFRYAVREIVQEPASIAQSGAIEHDVGIVVGDAFRPPERSGSHRLRVVERPQSDGAQAFDIPCMKKLVGGDRLKLFGFAVFQRGPEVNDSAVAMF
ncbi:MAG: hypothetical protein JWL77_1580 [Chthonomonadaceae bacterium]|nr:hypothetical protein [Chthonomonadaceae bacterium]